MIDDFLRRAGRRKTAVPPRHHESGDCFRHGRNIGKFHRAALRGHREQAHLAGSDRLDDIRDVAEEHLHRSGQQRGNGRRHALIGHRDHVEPLARRQQRGRQMAQRTDAAGRVIDLPGTRPDIIDEFAEAADRQVGMHRKRHPVRGDHGDRRQIRGRVERQLLHLRHDGERRAARAIDRVAVVGRSRRVFSADRAARPCPVFDDERLAVCFRQAVGINSHDHVGHAARTVRHDDFDRAVRPVLRRYGGIGAEDAHAHDGGQRYQP